MIPDTGCCFLVVGTAPEPYLDDAWTAVLLEDLIDEPGRLWYFTEDRLSSLESQGARVA